MLPGLSEIDWSRPWFAPWRERGEPLAACVCERGLVDALNASLYDALRLGAGRLRFVEHGALPRHEAYESFIARTACVPTRANLHDFFNGLAWLVYPALKRRLNELQSEQLARATPGAPRGALRDALTLFDENAALLHAPPVLVEALARRDWRALFITHRAAWPEARLEVFGHALLDKLVRPRKAITAHGWLMEPWSGGDTMGRDAGAANSLTAERLCTKPFLPVPLLGVPGWWPANEGLGFYDDETVFRPAQ